MAGPGPNSEHGHPVMNYAQPCAQPDGPVCAFNLASIGAARRLA